MAVLCRYRYYPDSQGPKDPRGQNKGFDLGGDVGHEETLEQI